MRFIEVLIVDTTSDEQATRLPAQLATVTHLEIIGPRISPDLLFSFPNFIHLSLQCCNGNYKQYYSTATIKLIACAAKKCPIEIFSISVLSANYEGALSVIGTSMPRLRRLSFLATGRSADLAHNF